MRPMASVVLTVTIIGLVSMAEAQTRWTGTVNHVASASAAAAPSGPTPASSTANLIVTGIVTRDGQPLGNARVEVRSIIFPSWRHDTSTDASGRYRAEIDTPTPARVWVTAYEPSMNQPCAVWLDHTTSDGVERTADVSLTTSLEPLAAPSAPVAGRRKVAGTVYRRTSTGKQPVSGAGVAFDLSNDDYQAWTGTDADGRFTLCGLPVDSWLQIYASTRLLQGWSWVEPGGDAEIELTLDEAPAAPDPPTDLVVSSVTGNTVTLAWKAPASSTPTGYVLEGGWSPGGVLASIPTGSTATSFTFTAPSGVFFARLHALSGDLRSGASNEIRLVVNAPLPPSAPAALLGLVNGSKLALSWTNTFQGGAPTALRLNVMGAQTATIPLSVVDAVSVNGVLGGTYTFTLTASSAAGVSPPSNPVTLTVPASCSGPPGVPTYFAVARSGRSLTLTWNPPVSGAAVTSYVIHASGALTGSLPTFTRSISGTVGPGTYSLSVVAANECGTSAPTDVITVTVP
jgi:hypothetical protein